jgi:hypothetical protein
VVKLYYNINSLLNRSILDPAELIAFPERNYGSTILVNIFRAGKMENAN